MNLKFLIYLIIPSCIFISCSNQEIKSNTTNLTPTVLFTKARIDSLDSLNLLDSSFYSGMTIWGAVNSYYYNNALVKITTKSKGEAGYTKYEYYLNNKNKIIHIKYECQAPDWKKYMKDIGGKEENLSLMTYDFSTFNFEVKNDTTPFITDSLKEIKLNELKKMINEGYHCLNFLLPKLSITYR